MATAACPAAPLAAPPAAARPPANGARGGGADDEGDDDHGAREEELERAGTRGREEGEPRAARGAAGMSVAAWQKAARANLPLRRCKRQVQAVIAEMKRLAEMGGAHTRCLCLGTWARGALQDARRNVVGNRLARVVATETPWIDALADQVDLLVADAHLALGHLTGTLQAAERVIKRNLDAFAVARCLQLRAHIMVLIGADRLGEEDICECLRVLQGGTWRLSLNGEELAPAVLPPVPSMELTFSAADWHRTRRKIMQERHPEIRQLFETRSGFPGEGFNEAVVLLAIFALHVILIAVVSHLQSVIAVLALSATVGAAAVYGFQALNHDLSHVTRVPGLRYVAMILSSSLCVFPWAMYYQNYHAVHHAFTGTDMDRDGDILFQPWYSPPRIEIILNRTQPSRSRVALKRWSEYFEDETSLQTREMLLREFADRGDKFWVLTLDLSTRWQTRFLWSLLVPTFMYVMFLVRKALLDRPHRPMIQYEGLMLIAQIICWRMGGFYALAYVWLSGSFSHGGACHPYFGFWLIQHENTWRHPKLDEDLLQFKEPLSMHQTWRPQAQPTLSYTGSSIWQYANFGELQHVEHHDFPMIPARHYPKLRALAPEFYEHLETRSSVMDAIKLWLFAPSDETWMQQHGDFARRDVYIDDLWMRRYTCPYDTPEVAEALLDRLTNPNHRSVTMGCCVACATPLRAMGRTHRGLLVARGAALPCGCYGVPLHASCARSLDRCPSCERPCAITNQCYCLQSHVHSCLSRSRCSECATLNNQGAVLALRASPNHR